MKSCINCNKPFNYRTSGQQQCRECWIKMDKKGSNCPNWKGGNPLCADCKIILNTRNRYVKRCWKCFKKWNIQTGRKPHNWKGFQMKSGYRTVYVSRKRPHVLEHRYVMEQHIGRQLKTEEIVHHLNGIKHDNRIENLTLTNRKEHEHCTFIKQLQKRIRELEKLNPVK